MKLKELEKYLNEGKTIKALRTAYNNLTGELLEVKLNESKGMFGYNVSLDLTDGVNDFQITESWRFFDKKEYVNYMPIIKHERAQELEQKAIRMIVLWLSEITE